jgi:hypothetical protein
MKLNRKYFEGILNTFDDQLIKSKEIKDIYIYNYILLVLLDTAKNLGYNTMETDTFLFINRVYSEIIAALNDNYDFVVEFTPETGDISFERY